MVVTLSGELVVGAAGATLTGPPALLFNISGDEITGPSAFSVAPLANETRLEGEGQLGNGTIELTNAASGSIFSGQRRGDRKWDGRARERREPDL
jgi:hypothetical protein